MEKVKELDKLYTPIVKNEQIPSSSTFISQYVQSHLTHTSNPAEIYATRIKNKQIMFENPAKRSRTRQMIVEQRARRKAQREKKAAGGIGKMQAKVKGVWKLDETQARWSLFLPLHRLWMGYMSELLGLRQPPAPGVEPRKEEMPSSAGMHPKLIKADFNGSIVTVRESKNPCLIGISGIVIHETENTFKVITEKNSIKVLPKGGSNFSLAIPLFSTLPADYNPSMPYPLSEKQCLLTALQVPHMQFELYGNQFRFRSADRAGRKFKHKETIEL